MSKFYELSKSSFEFNWLDQSIEFQEFFDYVFQRDFKTTVLFFVFKKGIKKRIKENIKQHVIEYYVNQRGYKECKFLNQ